jgi:hypothetical protein
MDWQINTVQTDDGVRLVSVGGIPRLYRQSRVLGS